MRRSGGRLAVTSALAWLAWSAAAHGQDAPPPASAEPTDRPTPDYPEPAPPFAPSLPAPPADAFPAADGTVVLADVRVDDAYAAPARPDPAWEGTRDVEAGLAVTAAPGELLDGAWVRRQFADNGLIGSPVALERAVALVELINRAFIENGYINSGVVLSGPPPANGATLELRLLSGRLTGAATVGWADRGDGGLSQAYVLDRMPSAGRVPLNAIALERDFRLLTEDPAIQTVNASLRPGARPGEASLDLIVDPAPRFSAYAAVANNRSPTIGGTRWSLGGAMRNALAAGDLFSAEAGLVGDDRQDFFARYDLPIIDTATTAWARGSYNEAAVVDAPLRPLDIRTRELAFEGGVDRIIFRRPLTPRADGRWSAARTATLGLNLVNRRTTTFLLGRPFSFSPGSIDGRAEYTAFKLSAGWTQRNVDEVLSGSLIFTQGLGGTHPIDPDVLAPETDFRTWLAQVSYARRLNASGLELRARLLGQWADGILYSGERLAFGGEASVRGYRETAVLADAGAIGSIELAQPFSISGRAARSGRADWGRFAVSAFVDGGYAHNREPPRPDPDWLASAGVSLAWTPSDAIFARITYARRLLGTVFVGERDLQDRGFQFAIVIRPLLLFGD